MRNYKIDSFKFFASIGVVIIHASAFMTANNLATFGNYYWWRPILEICVPFFFITSGYLLANKPSDYYLSYIKKILMIFIQASLLYLLIDLGFTFVISHLSEGEFSILHYLGESLSLISIMNGTIGSSHLWYLSSLVIATSILSFLKKMKLKPVFILVLSISIYLISMTTPLKNFEMFKSGGFTLGLAYLSIGYFITTKNIRVNKIKIYLLLIMMIYMLSSYLTGMGSYLSEVILLLFGTVFIIFIVQSKGTKTIFSQLGKYSLSIYILHMVIVALYDNIASKLSILNINPDVLRIIIVTLFSTIFSILMQKMFSCFQAQRIK